MRFAFIVASLLISNAYGQNCESVIALSRTSTSLAEDRESIEQQADKFCSDYSKSTQSGKSMDVGGSYGIFSASVGMTNQSAEAIATKYCQSNESNRASKNAYKSYVESISPKAYHAYERCLELSKKELKYSVDQAALLPNQFVLFAHFDSSRAGIKETIIDISPSDGITCVSKGKSVDEVNITTGSTIPIICRRTDAAQAGSVSFSDRGDGGGEPLTLPWMQYDAQGNSVDTLLALQQRIAGLETKLQEKSAVDGVITLIAKNTRPIEDQSIDCPEKNGLRGELTGYQPFPKSFAERPSVNIGITSINMGGPPFQGVRLTITVNSVDRNGFNYSFYTWCNTPIASAQARWMAVSR